MDFLSCLNTLLYLFVCCVLLKYQVAPLIVQYVKALVQSFPPVFLTTTRIYLKYVSRCSLIFGKIFFWPALLLKGQFGFSKEALDEALISQSISYTRCQLECSQFGEAVSYESISADRVSNNRYFSHFCKPFLAGNRRYTSQILLSPYQPDPKGEISDFMLQNTGVAALPLP